MNPVFIESLIIILIANQLIRHTHMRSHTKRVAHQDVNIYFLLNFMALFESVHVHQIILQHVEMNTFENKILVKTLPS